MASFKVMPTSSPSTPQPPLLNLTSDLSSLQYHHHHHHNLHLPFSSSTPVMMSPPDHLTEITLIDAAGAISTPDHHGEPSIRRKTVDDVWEEIVSKRTDRMECKVETTDNEMITLEDFLTKSGAGINGGDDGDDDVASRDDNGVVEDAKGIVPPLEYDNVGRRRKRRGGSVLEPLDKAAQQRQRRMIKNRESAARSRERKQAYQVELESLAANLEKENLQLQREKVERAKERYRQLMEKVIPVIEKRRPPRQLRRVQSTQW